jgi:hypothetical protein
VDGKAKWVVTDDLGYFGTGNVTWWALADPATGVGGIGALFLQAGALVSA